MILRSGSPREAGMITERVDYAKKKVRQWIEEDISPAFLASVARNVVIFFHEAFGKQSGAKSDIPPATDTIFPLYSISKSVVSVLAMTMMEDGLFSINRPLAAYMPELEGENKGYLNVHHLFTHTSGMTDSTVWHYIDERMQEYEKNPSAHPVPDDLEPWVYFGLKAPLDQFPGRVMNYCNFGVGLLGALLTRVSQKPLDELLRERVFDPLGMCNTFLVVPKEKREQVFVFPQECEVGTHPNQTHSYESQSPSGGIYSTVDDMQVFAQMLLNRGSYNGVRVLSPITVDYMTRNWIKGVPAVYGPERFPEGLWGLCWNICGDKLDVESGPLKSESAYVHGGAGRCMLWIDPHYQLAGILFYPKMPPDFRRFDDLFRNIIMSSILE